MIRVNQVKLPVSHSEADLRKKTAKMMGVSGRSDTVGGAGAPVSGCAQKARSVLFICIRCCSGRERGGDCQTCAPV